MNRTWEAACMAGQEMKSRDAIKQRQKALSRWDNEGGALAHDAGQSVIRRSDQRKTAKGPLAAPEPKMPEKPGPK